MPQPLDPNKIEKQFEEEELDKDRNPTGGLILWITRADGSREKWWRLKGQDPNTHGVLIGKDTDTAQQKVWQAQEREARAESQFTQREARLAPDPAQIQREATGGDLAGLQRREKALVDRYNAPETPPGEKAAIAAELDKVQGEIITRQREDRLALGRPRYPDEIAVNLAHAGYYGAQTRQIEQGLLPQQQLLLENHFKTLDQLEAMLRQRKLDPKTAGQYMEQSRQYLEAALRGTTPSQQQEARQKQKQFEQTLGGDILNQRLSSGAALSNALVNSASSLLSGGQIIPRGERVRYNPLQAAQQQVDTLGGGSGMTDFAKSLLGAASSPAGAPSPDIQAPGTGGPGELGGLPPDIQAPGGTPGAITAGIQAPGGVPSPITPEEMNRLLAGG